QTPVGGLVPKVLDFGISKLVDEATGSPTLTGSGVVMGTTPYLSPEQITGQEVDARSDQYALGVILYECATGRRPHEGDSIFALSRASGGGVSPPLRSLRPQLPEAFEAVVLRAMALSPSARFESVFALGQALLPFASPKRRLIWADYFDQGRGDAAG